MVVFFATMMLMIDDFRPMRPRPPRDVPKPEPSHRPAAPIIAPPETPLPLPLPEDEPGPQPTPPPKKTRKNPWHSLRNWVGSLSKKQKILFFVAVALILFGLGGTGYAIYKETHQPKPKPVAKKEVKPQPPPKPTTEASRLTGVQTSPELAKRPVTGIMIENSPEARPQSGLKDAGVVYEAIAEGGITRFLALYEEAQPDYIGPVRSSRPYYLDFLLPYDAAYAHVGGSPDALAQIKSLGVKDLDQFFNSAYYSRITQRYAPHNVYTSMAKMDEAKNAKGYTASNFTGFTRKAEAPNAAPTANAIDIAISGPLYNVHYDYDKATNSYKRGQAGQPHIDEKSAAQLTPKVAIALVMSRSLDSDGKHTNYQAVGSGAMFVFQDGIVTQGTWKKADRKAQFTFTDSAGKPLKLNPGQTWLTMVDGTGSVVFKP
jgi:hypothetical protein